MYGRVAPAAVAVFLAAALVLSLNGTSVQAGRVEERGLYYDFEPYSVPEGMSTDDVRRRLASLPCGPVHARRGISAR